MTRTAGRSSRPIDYGYYGDAAVSYDGESVPSRRDVSLGHGDMCRLGLVGVLGDRKAKIKEKEKDFNHKSVRYFAIEGTYDSVGACWEASHAS